MIIYFVDIVSMELYITINHCGGAGGIILSYIYKGWGQSKKLWGQVS